ncbi:MAG: HAD-IC family P-type ATPase [Patescibacteria group bacterium]
MIPRRDTWIEYALVLLPGLGLIVVRVWPWTWPFLVGSALAAALPFFLATLRGLLDRRFATEAFPVVAFFSLLLLRDWNAAAAIVLILGMLRLAEQRMEDRSLAALGESLTDIRSVARPDEIVTLEAGDRVPADGTIVHGTAFVDQALITGEQESVERRTGDPVFAGTSLRAGSIKVRVRAVGGDTLMERMRAVILDAHRWPSAAERVAGHVSAFSYWVLALLAMIVWFFFKDIERLAAVLLVLRPDALEAVVSLTASLAAAAAGRLGAMVRGGDALDRLATANVAVFDKSGPLTFDEIRIGRLEHDREISDAYVWECIAVAESSSRHPVGRALYREAMRHIGRVSEAESLQNYPGRGVVASLGGHEIVVGTAELHRAYGVTFDGAWLVGSTTPIEGRVSDGFLALDGRCVARLRIEEHPRTDIRSALERLRALGVTRDVLFTPDTVRIAAKQAATVGLSDYRPSMTPAEKWKELGRLSQEGRVLLIGDGIQDAVAMNRAHIGVAVVPDGTPVEGVRIALAADELSRLPDLLVLGRVFRGVIRLQSVIWIVTGLFGLILTSFGWLTPVSAAGYAFTTSVVLHAFTFRILPKKKPHGQTAQNKGT